MVQTMERRNRRLPIDAGGRIAYLQLDCDSILCNLAFVVQISCEKATCKWLFFVDHLDECILLDKFSEVFGTECSCSGLESVIGKVASRRTNELLYAGSKVLAFPVGLHKAFELLDDQGAKGSNVVLVSGCKTPISKRRSSLVL
jgi:hypothetical protein